MIRQIVCAVTLTCVLFTPDAHAKLNFGKPSCPAEMSCIETAQSQSAMPPPISAAPTGLVPSVCVSGVMGNLDQQDMPVCEAFIDSGAGTRRQRATALVNLGHGYTRMPGTITKPEVAMAAWDKAIAEDPTFAEPHAIKGDIAARKRNSEAAVAEFDRALGLDPGHWRARMGKANIFMRRGQTHEALELARQAIAAAQNVGVAHQIFGDFLEDAGMFTEALAQYRLATRDYDPKIFRRLPGIWQLPPPWTAVADMEMRLGHTHAAIEAINHEIDGRRVQNVSPDIFVQRGEYLEAASRFTDAANDYEKSLMSYGASFPNADEIRTRIAILRAKAGDKNMARDTFRDLIRSGKLKSILRIQVFLKNNGYDINIDGNASPALERALEQCLTDSDCNATMGQAI